MEFSQARINYNHVYGNESVLPKSFCTVDGKFVENIKIKDVHGKPNEEFYKTLYINYLLSISMLLINNSLTSIYLIITYIQKNCLIAVYYSSTFLYSDKITLSNSLLAS